MKIVILSTDKKLYSTKRLREAAISRGHKVRIIHPTSCSLYIEEGKPAMFVKGKRIGKIDAVIPRIASSLTYYGTAVVRQFEQMGIFCLNSSYAIAIARDKLRTMQILSRHHIGIPPTAFVSSVPDVAAAIEQVGKPPVVIKLLAGTQGAGVMLAESQKVAEAIVSALKVSNQNVIIQKFIAESRGKDIRAFVVGDKVVAAMRRTAAIDEEFRSNVHLGGLTEKIDLDPRYEKLAVRAAQVLGLHVVGVDLLESSHGPMIMELNASPGLEGIETATQVAIAERIIEFLEEQVLFPDIDIRERLSLSRGYSIVEVPVLKDSQMVDKTLEQTNLSAQGIQVLSITRNNQPISNPLPSEKLYPRDVLLLFGKQLSLRQLFPERVQGKRNQSEHES